MAITKCDKPMARHKMWKNKLDEGWRCTHDCGHCICALKKNDDGTWEHIKINDDGTAKQKSGRKKDDK